MLSKIITKRKSFLGERLEESRIIFIYRYISLIITSTFYFLDQSEHLVERKIFIICCISISAIILANLYLIYENSNKNIIALVLIETIGNSILLIPSGGINSPFIWYTLNTILISSIFLKKRYCWINILVYIFLSSIIIYFGTNSDLDILNFIRGESNLVLSFIMIIAAIQIWSIFLSKIKEKSKSLEEVNRELQLSNEMVMESRDHIMALYQAVNLLTNQGNKEGIIKLLFEYIRKITKTDMVFYYDISDGLHKMISENNNDLLKKLEGKINKDLKDLITKKEPVEISLSNTGFILLNVKSIYGDYGIFGLKAMNTKESIIYKNNIYQLKFLSELTSIAFEKFYLEEINARLLITEEQNRIANDLHDSVLQRLFSMSCGTFSLMKKLDKYTIGEIKEELNSIRESTNTIMKELRSKIYGLSWNKYGNNSFIIDIRKYIDDIKRFNNINIPFLIMGSDELLSNVQKKAIYRIICEGVGNAVRHGNAENIEINLDIGSLDSTLSIVDDGIGFDLIEVRRSGKTGLGILNLYQLAESLHGEIKINSKIGNGTRIEVTIPNNIILMKREEPSV